MHQRERAQDCVVLEVADQNGRAIPYERTDRGVEPDRRTRHKNDSLRLAAIVVGKLSPTFKYRLSRIHRERVTASPRVATVIVETAHLVECSSRPRKRGRRIIKIYQIASHLRFTSSSVDRIRIPDAEQIVFADSTLSFWSFSPYPQPLISRTRGDLISSELIDARESRSRAFRAYVIDEKTRIKRSFPFFSVCLF